MTSPGYGPQSTETRVIVIIVEQNLDFEKYCVQILLLITWII